METEQQLELSEKERQHVVIEIRKIVEQLGLGINCAPTLPIDSIPPEEAADHTDSTDRTD